MTLLCQPLFRRARRLARAVVLVLVLAGLPAVLSAPPVSAQSVVIEPGAADIPIVRDPRVGDELDAVAVDGTAVAEAYARYKVDETALQVAKDDEARARGELAELAEASDRLEDAVNRATRQRDKAEKGIAERRRAVAAIAVEDYVLGDSTSLLDQQLSARSATRSANRRATTAVVREIQLEDLRAHHRTRDQATTLLDQSREELEDVRARERDQNAALDDALGRSRRLEPMVDAGARAIGDARLTSTVRGGDFALVALDAYHRAAQRLASERPACGVRWSLVAGIGKTESGHGTFGGSSLAPNGDVTRRIIGIPLDGTNGTAVIDDTDGGQLDGDTSVDRAVGPMQFIPSTWARWARDGNGDGRSDPQNVYDAALTTAVYLCIGASGLGSDEGLRSAVYRYNNSDSYVDIVLSRARAYEGLGVL